LRFDLATTAPPPRLEYDVCIVGSGPAGTTVANELAGQGLRVCVLESGRKRRTRHAESLKAVVSDGIEIKAYSRERVLGGASSTWAGLSSPFDPIDFEHRPYLDESGWPFGADTLAPYYERAARRYRFPAPADFGPDGFARLAKRGDLDPEFRRVEKKIFLACAEPQRFGKEFAALWERDDTDLFLDATVVELVAQRDDDGASRVTSARFVTSGGAEHRVRARAFVLATGGIENARLLLMSRGADPAGLGNRNDQVGRYAMNHPKNYHGVLRLPRAIEGLPLYFGAVYRGFAGYAGLRLTEEEQRRRGVLNSYVRLEPLFPWSDNPGVESLVLLAKRTTFLVRGMTRTKGEEVVELRDYSETGDDSALQNERKGFLDWLRVVWYVVRHSPSVALYLFFRLSRKKPRIRRVRLRNFMEMEPRPEHRVTLSDEKDVLGLPKPLVSHRPTELDQRSLVELHRALASEFEAAGFGRLETRLDVGPGWPIDQDASHHMGTTRIGRDPARSVCDVDARVHDTANV
jgi:choline dehydrogenase-like flavoprotein